MILSNPVELTAGFLFFWYRIYQRN